MSNEVAVESVEIEADAPNEPAAPAPNPAPLVLVAGDDDIVCIDDTCLPVDAAR